MIRLMAAMLALCCVWGIAAQAQLLSSTAEYRVVEVDVGGQRIGVAGLDADPNRRQNWVYLKNDTRVLKRVDAGGGAFREEPSSVTEALTQLAKGKTIKVQGGRDWDGSINAKKLEILEPTNASGSQAATALSYPASGWSGTVLESTESSVLLELENGSSVILPRSIGYSAEPIPGEPVQAFIPAGSGELVAATSQAVTLRTAEGLLQVPTPSLPKDVKSKTMVPVLTSAGKSTTLPLTTALELQRSEGAAIVAPAFSTAGLAEQGAGVVLQSGPDFTLLASPTGEIVRVARAAGSAIPQPGFGIQVQGKGSKISVQPWAPGKGKGKSSGKGGKPKVKLK